MLRNRSEEQVKVLLKDLFRSHMPLHPNQAASQGVDVEAERRKDHISHYILRLAYCRRYEMIEMVHD
jgi:DNA primase large subunit